MGPGRPVPSIRGYKANSSVFIVRVFSVFVFLLICVLGVRDLEKKMAVNYMSSVPRLLGRENYDEWSFAAENFMVLEGLLGCLDGTVVDTVQQVKAKAKLVLTIDASLYVHVKESKDAKELWDKLKSMYADAGSARKIFLLRQLISLRFENFENMEAYVSQMIQISQRLKLTGFSIDDQWVGSLLLAGLPERFSPMIMAIEHSGINITTDSIKNKLLDMQAEGSSSATGSALAAKFSRQRRDGAAGPGVKKSTSTVKCFRCKQLGHYMNKCPNKHNDVEPSSTPRKDEKKKVSALSAVFLNGKFNSSDWYIDSGASMHITSRKDWLEDVHDCQEMAEIMIADKSTIPVFGQGSVRLQTIVNNMKQEVHIKNVLHVPDITTNLLSVSQMIKNGNSVIFDETNCKIYNSDNELIAVAEAIENVYRLIFDKQELDQCSQVTNNFVGLTVSGEVWHRRLAHVNYNDLKAMQSHGSVEGLITDRVECQGIYCETCCEGKQTRLPFKHEGKRADFPLEVIHADICGPMEEISVGGSRYFILFIDDFSRYTHVYFLKTKDEALEYFKEYKMLVENKIDAKIKIFRSDNGGEFCGSDFESFLKKHGIQHQKTNPHTPEQNGLTERMNRTVVEKARCLLFDANLSKKFWAEAINTAIYLRNRCIASGLNYKTPYELWLNKRPDISHVRIFGSEVMVHIPKVKRRKFDKKSKKMILVGFDENVKGYRLYDPDDNNVITSRDVVINEKILRSSLDVVVSEPAVIEKSEEKSVSVGDLESYEDISNIDCDINDPDYETSDSDFVISSEDLQLEEPETVRRSERQRVSKKFEDYVTYICATDTTTGDCPLTVTEALSGPDKERWKQAMMEEIESFNENETWELVNRPSDRKIVECKWVYKVKSDSDGDVYRARLVAKGFTQRPGIDYDETFAPVIRHSSFRLLIALSVNLGLTITHLDVKTAFLNGFLEEDVYMHQPDGFVVKGSENKIYKLNKAVYGLKQSSRAWNKRVDEVLHKLGYIKSKYEPCLYTKTKLNSLTIVALYVDDFFVFSDNDQETMFLKEQLNNVFKIKDLGEAKQCLGVRVRQNHAKNIVSLDQEQYIEQILKRFHMMDCKSVSTPIDPKIVFENESVEDSEVCSKDIPYQKLIGSLMYVAVLTRPDITYAVSFLSQFNNCYTNVHWRCAKRVLRYLKGTKDKCLNFSRNGCELEGYVDADWASNAIDRKSYTGFVFKLSGGAISWKSIKQKSVALSSTEAEYIAMSEASKEAIYLRNLVYELTGKLDQVELHVDNQSALKLATNPVFHERSKHIDVRYHFIREVVSKNVIKLVYLPTGDMTADILTKGLQNVKHSKFVEQLGLVKALL